MQVEGANSINGHIDVPADKSISHRSAIISSLTHQKVRIRNFLFADDCINTLEVLKKTGTGIETEKGTVTVQGRGIEGLKEPDSILYVGNSGTTLRLMAGILAGTGFLSILSGDSSINRRPMARIIQPLTEMGASIYARSKNTMPPLAVIGSGPLKGRIFEIPVASAQVKSCLCLAAVNAAGKTEIRQPAVSRDHTERMLAFFGADISYDGRHTALSPSELTGRDLFVPGDISSAAYFIVACLILDDSRIVLKDVGINPTRSYFLEVLKNMGAGIEVKNIREFNNEPVADIYCCSSNLSAAKIDSQHIPNIIDEIPILCVAAAKSEGKTVIEGAQELRFKESDRINAIYTQFSRLGVKIEKREDGLEIEGSRNLRVSSGSIDSFGDHRIAMSCAILSLLAKGRINIENAECVNTSFPKFFDILKNHTS
ncbi:MAG: 3-phosphoshikimate 1-carboxyvinyltransferase [Actinomycetota bacterium]